MSVSGTASPGPIDADGRSPEGEPAETGPAGRASAGTAPADRKTAGTGRGRADGGAVAGGPAGLVPAEVDVEPIEPGESFVGDMDVASWLVTEQRCLMRAPLTEAVRSPAGCASVGMVTMLMDAGASTPALVACGPDWTATQDLSVHAAGWLTEGPIVVDNRLVRVGKKVIVVAADVYDGHGTDDVEALRAAIDGGTAPACAGPTLAATGLVVFARIPGTAAGDIAVGYDPGRWLGRLRHRRLTAPPAGTMYERMGLEVLDAPSGCLELRRGPYVLNSIGTIIGGAQTVLAEAAAEAARPGLVATDMQAHFVSQLTDGPARTSATVLRDAPDHSVVDVALVDAGNDDRPLALATVTLQRPPPRRAGRRTPAAAP